MKKNLLLAVALLLLATATMFQSGCLKDTGSKRYTVYTPVYKTTAEVRANVKSTTMQPVIEAGKMYVIGNYILLAERFRGIHIIDNTNPTNPVNKAFINIPGNEDMAVSGTTLYADCYTDLFVIDIADPMHATLKKHVVNLFPDRRSIGSFIVDTNRVIAEWTSRDTSMGVDVPEQGFLSNNSFFSDKALSNSALFLNFSSSSGGNTGTGGSMARFAIQNNYLYTVTTSKLNVVDIAQPQQPLLSKVVSIGWNIETIYPFKDKLFLGGSTGMQIYSVANPLAPVSLGGFSHARLCDPVVADGDYAYVTLRGTGSFCGGAINELEVVDVRNPSASTIVRTYALTNPRGLGKDGNTLFVCDGPSGLKCFDAASPTNITLRKTIPINDSYDVICLNKIAIVSAKDGLYQYDYHDLNNIKLISTISKGK